MPLRGQPPPLKPTHTVRWSLAALADIDRVEAYFAKEAPLAAQRLRLSFVEAGDALARYPYRGVRIRGVYRKLNIVAPYVIRYAVEGSTVTITSVRDGRREKAR